ncbi:hypothetical protein ACIO3O_01100 [Streptomyces sp. NPDC087440]|uniref:hypothetical protein n=1 Tax=Streptomyces sp. NPDC087440 TaxID=3365790 RepID=UPI003818C4EA
MSKSILRRAAVAGVALAALTVSCGVDSQDGRTVGASSPVAAKSTPDGAAEGAPAAPAEASRESEASESSGLSGETTPGPELVRDAFAGLQATLNDSCGDPGNCSYFLGRVYEELHGLDEAMKADPKGAGHFPEPIAWIKKLDTKLGGDHGFESLKKNQKLLIGTRDRINTWMQGHPDDYR